MRSCLICKGQKGFGQKIKARGFTYIICKNCGGATLVPRGKVLRCITKIYRPEYYDWHDPDGFRKFFYKIRIYESYPDWVERVAGASGKVLDVGAGVPKFLLTMKRRGWKPYAQELSKDQSKKIANELGSKRVISGDFEKVDIPWKSLRVITFWHVLEHVRQPVKALKKVRSLLADDGYVFAEMPNLNSLVWRLVGDSYALLSIPGHSFYFSESSLRKLFLVCGYDTVEITYPLKYNTILASSLVSLLSKKVGIKQPMFLSFIYYTIMPFAFLLNIVTSFFGRSEVIRVSAVKK